MQQSVDNFRAGKLDHLAIVIPSWAGMVPKSWVPPEGKLVSYVSAAGLIGTVDLDNVPYRGMLADKQILIIIDGEIILHNITLILPYLQSSFVSKRFPGGLMDYRIATTLWVIVTQEYSRYIPKEFGIIDLTPHLEDDKEEQMLLIRTGEIEDDEG
jgi:hypothetical protein